MSFLLDTCVISEAAKEPADRAVDLWLKSTAPDALRISVISFGEMKYGVERLPMGAKRRHLEAWLDELITSTPLERVLAVDKAVALRWAMLRVNDPNAGCADSQIAATALVHGLTLVTRNVKDFRYPGLAVFNPWAK